MHIEHENSMTEFIIPSNIVHARLQTTQIASYVQLEWRNCSLQVKLL